MAKTSPTQRSLKRLREEGYHAGIVEKYIQAIHARKDLFGWIDIVAIHPGKTGVLGVQTTTGDHLPDRLEKARGNAALVAWLAAGNSLVVHGWRKLAGRWTVREHVVVLTDLVRAS